MEDRMRPENMRAKGVPRYTPMSDPGVDPEYAAGLIRGISSWVMSDPGVESSI